MECGDRVRSSLKAEMHPHARVPRPIEMRDEGINHDVANEQRSPRNPLVAKVRHSRLFGNVKQVREPVRLDPVVLLWHVEIKAS
jgi:hypothetical protein